MGLLKAVGLPGGCFPLLLSHGTHSLGATLPSLFPCSAGREVLGSQQFISSL